MIEGDAFTAGLDNAGTGSFGEFEGSDGHTSGNFKNANIVSDGGDSDDNLSSDKVLNNSLETQRRTMSLTHVETFEDGSVEGRSSTTSQEGVQLVQ